MKNTRDTPCPLKPLTGFRMSDESLSDTTGPLEPYCAPDAGVKQARWHVPSGWLLRHRLSS